MVLKIASHVISMSQQKDTCAALAKHKVVFEAKMHRDGRITLRYYYHPDLERPKRWATEAEWALYLSDTLNEEGIQVTFSEIYRVGNRIAKQFVAVICKVEML